MRRLARRSFPLACIGIALAALCAPSLMAGQRADWSVVVANNAYLHRGAGDSGTPLTEGATIAAGVELSTGEDGTLVLSRGEDLVTMAANSKIAIVDPQPAATTLIEQPYGNVQYHVTKEKVPHFQVDAPLLATVVKGTTFSVSSSASKSSVTVSEGRVEARNRRTGATSSVGAGERGSVESRGRGVDVSDAPGNGGAGAAASGPANASPAGPDAGKGKGADKDADKDKDKSGDKGNGPGGGKGGSGGSKGGPGGGGSPGGGKGGPGGGGAGGGGHGGGGAHGGGGKGK